MKGGPEVIGPDEAIRYDRRPASLVAKRRQDRPGNVSNFVLENFQDQTTRAPSDSGPIRDSWVAALLEQTSWWIFWGVGRDG